MNSKLKLCITTMTVIALTIFFGCASVMEVITPSYVEKNAIEYADVNVPSFLPYTSLWDARKVKMEIDYKYTVMRLIQEMEYNHLSEVNLQHIREAEVLQQQIFSPEGPIGLLLPTLLGGAFGAVVIKRPGDTKKA